jgi:hypothetical protein
MILASCSPSRILLRTRLLGLPCSAISNPSVTSRSRRLSTDRVRQSKASAILASVQLGPSASAFNRMRARRIFCAATRCRFNNPVRISRSASVNRTTYFFRMAHPSLVEASMMEIARRRYPKLQV